MKAWKNLDGSDFEFAAHTAMLDVFLRHVRRGKSYFESRGASNDDVARYPLSFLQVVGGLLFVRDVFRVAGSEFLDQHLRKSAAFVDLLLKWLPTRISYFDVAPKASNGLSGTGIWCIQVALAINGSARQERELSDAAIEAIARKAVLEAIAKRKTL